ncbi:MAG: FeoA domain-containing protein [Campylobacterales bacterium]|nr:FeoA domain-containing protein [Campylobacterales bacterium]
MKLIDLPINTDAIITKIDCNEELKKRFYSFGIVRGAKIHIENTSMTKNTIEVNVENTSIGLRIDEAKAILVESQL